MPIPQKKNIIELKSYIKKAIPANQGKIADIIGLYEARKIPDYRTALNTVIGLYVPSMLKPGQAERKYQEVYNMYKDAEPATNRLKRQREEHAKKHRRKQEYILSLIFYTDAPTTVPSAPEDDLSQEQRATFKRYMNKKYKGLRQYFIGNLIVKGGTGDYFESIHRKLMRRKDKGSWKPWYNIMLTNEYFKERMERAPGYLEALYLLDYQGLTDTEGVDPLLKAKRSDKVMIEYKYCSNKADLSRGTFKEAIAKKHYKQHECFLNAVYETYGSTLLSKLKLRNRITRADILELIGRTETDVRDGITMHEMLPFFQKFKLKVRLYDIFCTLIFRYDPEPEDRNNKPFYAMTDGDHIYVLNHDINSLSHKLEVEENIKLYASPDFKIRDNNEYVDHKMINNIDDILQILRNPPPVREDAAQDKDTRRVTYLVQRQNDIDRMLWQLIDAGSGQTSSTRQATYRGWR